MRQRDDVVPPFERRGGVMGKKTSREKYQDDECREISHCDPLAIIMNLWMHRKALIHAHADSPPPRSLLRPSSTEAQRLSPFPLPVCWRLSPSRRAPRCTLSRVPARCPSLS